jgi:hypothetical protein
MGWVRARRRLGGWLALFALAVQLTATFDHIHAEDFQTKGLAPPSFNVATIEGDGTPAAPNHHPDHDDCPICAVAHLTGTAPLPAPPQFAVPVATPVAWRAAIERRIDPRAARQPFQARAPPQA